MQNKTKLTLGPVLFHWNPDRLADFYRRIADEAPVDTVIVGEVVCSKRAPFFLPHLPSVIERLESAGKEVIVGSLSLLTQGRETGALKELCDSHYLVEANDVAALLYLEGRAHTLGPFLNVYNEDTLVYLRNRGAVRICPPVELSANAVETLAAVPEMEIEVHAFGRFPLALSSRCYHARAHFRTKDSCQFVCEQDPDGLPIMTMDNQPFLAVNGVQTMSHAFANLLADFDDLRLRGVNRLRLSPHTVDMVAVSTLFRQVADGDIDSLSASARLTEQVGFAPVANGFYHGVEGAASIASNFVP